MPRCATNKDLDQIIQDIKDAELTNDMSMNGGGDVFLTFEDMKNIYESLRELQGARKKLAEQQAAIEKYRICIKTMKEAWESLGKQINNVGKI